MKKITTLVLLIGCASCTSQDVYHAVQGNKLRDCAMLPETQQAECKYAYGMSYEEYRHSRRSLISEHYDF